jgi:hypothetical protein
MVLKKILGERKTVGASDEIETWDAKETLDEKETWYEIGKETWTVVNEIMEDVIEMGIGKEDLFETEISDVTEIRQEIHHSKVKPRGAPAPAEIVGWTLQVETIFVLAIRILVELMKIGVSL